MKLFVIGKPIKHSLSPAIHNFWLKKYKLNNIYEKLELNEHELEHLIEKLRNKELVGVNVTIPYKKKMFQLVDKVSKTARISEAVNTVYIKDKDIIGDNTDGEGFILSVEKIKDFRFKNQKVLILGAGGASYGIIAALIKKDIKKIIIANRTKEKAVTLKSHFKKSNVQIDLLKWERIIPPNDTDLIVNTTSHGMKKDEIIELDISNLNKKCLFVDIIYKPQITETMKFFKKNGFRTLNGLGMLVYQAAISFNMWFGITLTKIDIEQALGICEKEI